MIEGLAEYEKLSHVVVATEAQIRETLFGPKPAAEVLLAESNGEWVGFALFFPDLLHVPRPAWSLSRRPVRETTCAR